MKRILSLVLSTLLVLTLIPLSAVSAVAEEAGDTTPAALSDDVTYTDVADYDTLQANIENGTISKSLRLTADIDFGGADITAEIATLANGVVFNGNGHSFKNFTVSAANADTSLFAVADGATVTIKDLTVGSADEGGAIAYAFAPTDATPSHSVLVARIAAGTTLNVSGVDIYANLTKSTSQNAISVGFVGEVNGTVNFDDCSFNGSINNKQWFGAFPKVAAFVGTAGETSVLTFNKCVNNAAINGQQRAAGFISQLLGTSLSMTDCTNNGSISGCTLVGGFIGDVGNSTTAPATGAYSFDNCINNGSVSATHNKSYDYAVDAGGYIGRMTLGESAVVSFTSCTNGGAVGMGTTVGCSEIGGFIGLLDAEAVATVTFNRCNNDADFTFTDIYFVGGFVGKTVTKLNGTTITYEACRNTGDISSEKLNNVGGFTGKHDLTAVTGIRITYSNCDNLGNITCTAEGSGYNLGGLVGNCDSSATDWNSTYIKAEGCINRGDITGSAKSSDKSGTGGLFGYIYARNFSYVDINYCVNTADITNTVDEVGGIVGYVFMQGKPNLVDLEATINAGSITGGSHAGGLVGRFLKYQNGLDFISSINVGDVTAVAEGGFAGGLLGYHNDFDAETPNNTGYYTVQGGGYYCTLTADKECNGLDTIEITEYASANAALEAMNGVCTVGRFTYDAENGFVFAKAPKFVGLQMSESYVDKNDDLVMDVRFIAVLENENYKAFNKVGFIIKAIDGDGTEVENKISDHCVYTSITANQAGDIKSYTAEELGGKYISALAIEGVPAVGTATFEITAYATDANDAELCDLSTYKVVFEDGVCASFALVID